MKDNLKTKINSLLEEIKQLRPLLQFQVKQIKEYYRIGLTYSSNAIEGNTLTEIETKVVLEDGITIGGKPLKDHLEAIGHSKAYDYIYEIIEKGDILEENILKLHYLFYSSVDSENAGKYRTVKVYITGTEYIPPKPDAIPLLMKKFIEEIPARKNQMHPVEFASWLHLEFVTIHPFIDGNGRCARLLMNLSLLKDSYPIVIIPPVLRKDYMESLMIAQSKKDAEPFYDLMAEIAIESLKDYKKLLTE